MNGCGVAYKLTRPAMPGGPWTETILHSFTAKTGAIFPVGAPIFDGKGNLYGATQGGTADGHSLGSAAYRLTPPTTAGAVWNFRLLFSFGGPDTGPQAGMISHKSGRLYGTTGFGGEFGEGSVFELSPPVVPGDLWTENILYSFLGGADGSVPTANVIFDRVGNLYGTTQHGGEGGCASDTFAGCGTVFKLAPPATNGGNWTEMTLHRFDPTTTDGLLPSSGLLLWKNGVLFGVTPDGGRGKEGTVYGIVP